MSEVACSQPKEPTLWTTITVFLTFVPPPLLLLGWLETRQLYRVVPTHVVVSGLVATEHLATEGTRPRAIVQCVSFPLLISGMCLY